MGQNGAVPSRSWQCLHVRNKNILYARM